MCHFVTINHFLVYCRRPSGQLCLNMTHQAWCQLPSKALFNPSLWTDCRVQHMKRFTQVSCYVLLGCLLNLYKAWKLIKLAQDDGEKHQTLLTIRCVFFITTLKTVIVKTDVHPLIVCWLWMWREQQNSRSVTKVRTSKLWRESLQKTIYYLVVLMWQVTHIS